MLEQQAERGGRLAMASQHETARGVAVEPMGQHRRPRQAEAQRVEGGFQIGAALGAAMHRQPRRLVDHQHQPVAMEHAGLDFLRGQFGNFDRSVETFAHGAKPLTHPRHERHSGKDKTELVAAAVQRAEAHLEFARDRGRRSRHQAQARPRHARGYRGRAAARRSRHRGGGAHFGRGRPRPLRQDDLGRRRESRGRDRSREGAVAGGKAAGDRRGAKAVRHSGGRRQRFRQDHHHRQARRQTGRRRPQGDAGGRRHLSRRRDRAAEDLGRAHQIAGDRGRAGLGFREPCLQCADRGARAASSTCC